MHALECGFYKGRTFCLFSRYWVHVPSTWNNTWHRVMCVKDVLNGQEVEKKGKKEGRTHVGRLKIRQAGSEREYSL